MPKSAGDGWKTTRCEPRVPSCMLENPARVWRLLSRCDAQWHTARFRSLWVAPIRTGWKEWLEWRTSCVRCGVHSSTESHTFQRRHAVVAGLQPTAAPLRRYSLLNVLVAANAWAGGALNFRIWCKRFWLARYFHNPQPKLNNSLELFAAALLLLTLNYYHSCSLMWSCFFMWLLHHEKKNPPSQCGFCRPRNSKPRWWRLTKPAAHLVNVTKLAAVCVNRADACHGSSRISSISLLLPEPGRRTLTVNALYHARQTKEMGWFGFY